MLLRFAQKNKVLHPSHVQKEVLENEQIIQVCVKILFLFTFYYLPYQNTGNIMEGESAYTSIQSAGACISNFRKTLFLLKTLVTSAKVPPQPYYLI